MSLTITFSFIGFKEEMVSTQRKWKLELWLSLSTLLRLLRPGSNEFKLIAAYFAAPCVSLDVQHVILNSLSPFRCSVSGGLEQVLLTRILSQILTVSPWKIWNLKWKLTHALRSVYISQSLMRGVFRRQKYFELLNKLFNRGLIDRTMKIASSTCVLFSISALICQTPLQKNAVMQQLLLG